ncbi:MAG TPA: hypothetical protein VKK19_08070 [Candidatus Dormibacteraeota bacterium]|nr:hypothetical protein [Candidatus Dormibacteraeota bacterium]
MNRVDVSDDPRGVVRVTATSPSTRQAVAYLKSGLAISRPYWSTHALIFLVYSAPAAAAAWLAASAVTARPAGWAEVARLVLPYVTAIVGTVVVMVAVSHQAHGHRIGLIRVSLKALPWVPRYFWTNVHTSVIFWVPIGLLLLVRSWQEAAIPLAGGLRPVVAVLWWLGIGLVALVIHTRTLLAPFFAIHGDLPGTLSALEAWRASGRHFRLCLVTLVVAGGPVAVPLGALALGLTLTLSGQTLAAFLNAVGDLVWVGIQAVRPVLIPAVYALYGDLWNAELARRRQVGEPPIPAFARPLLALTRPLPNLGRLSGTLYGDGTRAV